MLNGVWIGVTLGGLSARFRDVPPIVASIMQVAFFLTPIFWTPSALPSRELFVHLNPFYYLSKSSACRCSARRRRCSSGSS